MNIVIPLAGRVRMCIRSSFVAAQRTDAVHFDLTGDTFNLMQVTDDQVYVFPDEVEVTEGQEVTDEMISHSLPLVQFVRVSAEEAVPAALGLLLRLAIADGRLTDAELLSIQPALEGRLWQPGIEVKVGDVYTFGAFLWRCLQEHTTQGTWTPDLVPSLWHKVEVISEDTVRVWEAGIDYIVGDEVAYPDADGTLFTCLQAHTAQDGWEPPNVPSLWQEQDASGDAVDDDAGLTNEENQYEIEA
jgi:hypothetical protein